VGLDNPASTTTQVVYAVLIELQPQNLMLRCTHYPFCGNSADPVLFLSRVCSLIVSLDERSRSNKRSGVPFYSDDGSSKYQSFLLQSDTLNQREVLEHETPKSNCLAQSRFTDSPIYPKPTISSQRATAAAWQHYTILRSKISNPIRSRPKPGSTSGQVQPPQECWHSHRPC
jgi:hypothetical protein